LPKRLNPEICKCNFPRDHILIKLFEPPVGPSGLPDGLFSNQKSQFGKILVGLRLENVDIVCGHLEYFTDVWDFYDHLLHFVFIWYMVYPVLVSYTKKNLASLRSLTSIPACDTPPSSALIFFR
jgi:hypothetical protein